jgi:hypothetical protein
MTARWLASLLASLALFGAGVAWGALGTSAATDGSGVLWVVYAEAAASQTHVVVMRANGATWSPPMRINAQPEPVAADGENRPKIAFGPKSEIYVSWTSPTSSRYTADIRFVRSLDGGSTWSQPHTVHRDRQMIAHRFESLAVDAAGRIWITWIDKRDLEAAGASRRAYAGAAVYYAYSEDRGASWRGDFKFSDHSCECCRIALVPAPTGGVAALWRHVFANSERDHAFALLGGDARPRTERATHDRWRVDACPHHGPSLAFTSDGARHAVWFNHVNGEGRVSYGRLTQDGPINIRELPAGAAHADIAAVGRRIAIAWRRFDGERTSVQTWLSADAGATFSTGPQLHTQVESDQPRLVASGEDITLLWRRADGLAMQALFASAAPSTDPTHSDARSTAGAGHAIRPFGRDTLRAIEQAYAGQPFWLVLWDLECTYCMQSLRNLAAAQRRTPSLRAVTLATDPLSSSASALQARLAEIGVISQAYAFGDAPAEALRYAIDPNWHGEKPRAYRYGASGKRTSVTGVITRDEFVQASHAAQR